MLRLASCLGLLAACAPSLTPTHPGEQAAPLAPPADPAALAPVAVAAPESLADLLEALRAEHGVPALAALVRSRERVLAEGAAGVRRAGGDAPVTLDDRWHLGSCTKSMTATLAGVLVARGTLTWSTTVGESFPDVAADPGWAPVALEQLLTNSAGAPAGLQQDGLWGRLWELSAPPAEQRRTLVEGVLAHPPEAPPGTRNIYSNAGFAIAGALLERTAQTPYEELLAREVFAPLDMQSAGFGAPGTAGAVDEPFGHVQRDGKWEPVELGPGDDNPAAITPAGRVHASLRDWGKYAALHLAGAQGKPLPLPFKAVDFAMLHRPRLADYAMGWMASSPDWCRGPLLWHNGSNTMWYCEIALFPEEDLAILVASNAANREAVGAALRRLHERWAPPPQPK